MWTNAVAENGGFLLRAAINSLRSSLQTPAVRYALHWTRLAVIWTYIHPTTCCSLFLLLPILQMIFQCASWVICLGAALAVLWWTNLCLHSCFGARISIFVVPPANLPVLDPLSPGGCGCVSMMCWCGIAEEDDNKRKWEALRTI